MPVILQREVKISKLMGFEEEPEKVDTFVKEVRRAWELTPGITEARRLDLVKDNVGPIVRDEIACMDADLTAEQVLEELRSVFGEKRSPVQLRDVLRSTRQLEGEQVRRFSHRVKAAHTALVSRQKALGGTQDKEDTLVEQLIDGIQCPTLSRYLQEQQVKLGSKFRDLREIAIRWTRDELPSSPVSVNVQSVAAQKDAERDQHLDMLDRQVTALLGSVGELTTAVKDMATGMTAIKDLVVEKGSSGRPAWRQNQSSGLNAAGQRVCYRCQSPHHMVAACPRPDNRGNFPSLR